MSGRPWLPSEDAAVRAGIELPARVVAARIDRTASLPRGRELVGGAA